MALTGICGYFRPKARGVYRPDGFPLRRYGSALARTMMTKIKSAAVLMALFFSMAGASLAQVAGGRVGPRAVRRAEAYLAKLGAAGYSGTVSVTVGGKPVISKGFGYSDAER